MQYLNGRGSLKLGADKFVENQFFGAKQFIRKEAEMDGLALDDLSVLMDYESLLSEVFGQMDDLFFPQEAGNKPVETGERLYPDYPANDENDRYDLLAKGMSGPLRIISEHDISVDGLKIKICAVSRPFGDNFKTINKHRIDSEECEYYGSVCLDFAIKQKFPSFSCSRCQIFIKNWQNKTMLY